MDVPKIFVINLKHRTDRLQSITAELTRMGLLDLMEVVVGSLCPAHNTGTAGISLSHRRCVELAKQRQYPRIMILEDDCKFLVDPTELVTQLNSVIHGDEPWSGVWFGSFYRAIFDESDRLFRPPLGINQDTATLINQSAYDDFIAYYDYCAQRYVATGSDRYNIDMLLFADDPDDAIKAVVDRLRPSCLVSVKKLCGQADTYSDRIHDYMCGGHDLSL